MKYNDSSVETGRRHYYSSSQGPFYNANNIFMFYGGGDRGRTVESIIKELTEGQQVVHVHGERGSGKTMLSLVISDRLKHRFNTIRYDVPDLSASLLLRQLLIELCPQNADVLSASRAQEGASQDEIDQALNTLCVQLSDSSRLHSQKPYVLMIDSQTEIDEQTHQVVDVLSRVINQDKAAMHCVLFHRVLDENKPPHALQHQSRQLRHHYWLRRLTLAEINEYLGHHMLLFDFNRRDLFTREMGYFIADRSEGVFRAINTLARNAFTIASLEDADKLSMSHLLMAGLPPRPESSNESSFLSRHRGGVIALMGSCVVASAAAAVFFMR